MEGQKTKRAGISGEKAKPSRLPPTTVDLPLTAYISEEYVSDLNTRLGLYQGLAKVDRTEQIEAMAQEFADRFGAPPPEVRNLLYALRIKILASKAGIESISTEDRQIVLRRFQGMRFDKQQLEPYLREGITIGHAQLRLSLKQLGKEWRKVLEGVLGRINA